MRHDIVGVLGDGVRAVQLGRGVMVGLVACGVVEYMRSDQFITLKVLAAAL